MKAFYSRILPPSLRFYPPLFFNAPFLLWYQLLRSRASFSLRISNHSIPVYTTVRKPVLGCVWEKCARVFFTNCAWEHSWDDSFENSFECGKLMKIRSPWFVNSMFPLCSDVWNNHLTIAWHSLHLFQWICTLIDNYETVS